MASIEDRDQIAFFDVETTVPNRPGQGFAILEFGAILVCPRKLVELHSFSSLVRPSDLALVSERSVRCNGISRASVEVAPPFLEIADAVFEILHGRIWAGHNILRFDCPRIREAFAEIGRIPPEPKGTIDSLALLTQKFGRRAGNMKMATLATYFGIGQQTHRSLDDVRMNLEVLKYCATVLFLESSLPDILISNNLVSPNTTTRSRSNGKSAPGPSIPNSQTLLYKNASSLSSNSRVIAENHPISSLLGSNTPHADCFNMTQLSAEITIESPQQEDVNTDLSSSSVSNQGHENSAEFLDPGEVFTPSITASLVPFFRGSQKIRLLHRDSTLQLRCSRLKVRFGISSKFFDHAGRPRLNFVADAPANLCGVLDLCDDVAQKLSLESDSTSEWRRVVSRKSGFVNYPTVRFHIPTAVCGEIAIYATEIYQKDISGSVQRLVFSKFDASELSTLFTPGTFVDAFFSLDPYDYQQNAGIRLVAKKLIIHSD